MNISDSNSHESRRSAIRAIATAGVSALLILTLVAVGGSNYGVSLASGQLVPLQASGGNVATTLNRNATTTASTCMTQTARNTTTTGNSTADENAATKAARGAASEARMHIEEACGALQNNDTRAALMHLKLAIASLDEVQGNLTGTMKSGNATNPLEQLGKLFSGK